MRALPVISLRSHREVVAAKDETIRVQRVTIDSLTASLKAFEAYLESLKPKPHVRGEAAERAPRKVIDYANLDPSDSSALMAAALAEMGPGRHSAEILRRRMEHIKRQVVLSREAAAQRAQQPGPPPPPEAIPEAINKLIEETEAQGVAMAEAS